MNSKLKKLLFTCLTVALSNTLSLEAMDPLRQQIRKTLTAVHYGLAFSTLWQGKICGIGRIKGYFTPCISPHEFNNALPQEIRTFAYDALDQIDVEDPAGVILEVGLGYSAAKTYRNRLLSFDVAALAEWDFRKEQDDFKETFAAKIQREGARLNNNEYLKKMLATLVFPCITKSALWFIKKPFNPIKNDIIKNVIKVPSGMAQGCANILTWYTYSRYLALQADDGIHNDEKRLRAAIAGHRDYESKMIDLIHYLKQDGKLHDALYLAEWLADTLPPYINIEDHPSPRSRIKRLERRIEELKSKSDADDGSDEDEFFEWPVTKEESETK
jgi:hypothetical protein